MKLRPEWYYRFGGIFSCWPSGSSYENRMTRRGSDGFSFQTATPARMRQRIPVAAAHGSIVRSFLRGSIAATGCTNTPPGSAKACSNLRTAHRNVAGIASSDPFAGSGRLLHALSGCRFAGSRSKFGSALITAARISVTSSP